MIRGLDQLQNKIVHKLGREWRERERERERERLRERNIEKDKNLDL